MKRKKELKSKKIPRYQIIKVVFQIIFFIALPGLYINAFNGIKEIYMGIINQTFQFTTSLPALTATIAIIPITILLGRFFCGWMCAFGAYGDFLYFISKKGFRTKFEVPEKVDKILKYAKYLVLAFVVVGVWTMDITLFDSLNPGDAFGSLANIKGIFSIPYVLTEMLIGFIVLLLITIASFFVERFYCRYICPLGAVFTLISPLRIFKIGKKRDHCGSCNRCTTSCKMGIPMDQYDKISSGECIQCFKCITVCPRKNTNVIVGGRKFSPLIAGLLAVSSIILLYFGSEALDKSIQESSASNTSIESQKTTDTDTTVESEENSEATTGSQTTVDSASDSATDSSTDTHSTSDSATDSNSATDSSSATDSTSVSDSQDTGYKDGTYEGSGNGFRGGTTTVNVTIANGAISAIEVVSYDDDKPYFEMAYDTIESAILDNQNAEVDSVSGATFSSDGIKDAVADALSKAQ